MKDIDVEVLYGYNVKQSYDYLKDNTNYVDNINEDDIKEVCYSFNKDVFILLFDGTLYKNDNKILDNINTLGFSCGVFVYAFSNDREIMYLLNNDETTMFINNNNCKYKKIIIDHLKIVGLTNDNTIRFIGTLIDEVIDYERFYNVDDIGYVEDSIVIMKDNRVLGLFNNSEYEFDDVILLDSNEEYKIL